METGTVERWCVVRCVVGPRGAELFQATIVKAVRARLDEEHRSMEQLKRQ